MADVVLNQNEMDDYACITSYDKRKIDEMLRYYESKGCKLIGLNDLLNS